VKDVYVIPVKGAIGKPTLYIVRRALKDAIDRGVEAVVLDMKTPGGELQTTLEIMEALDKFPGETITWVNNEAISAGAFISVITDRIYFSPDGQIGAAEVVSGTGQEIPEGMKRKLQSYINAKVRGYTEEYRYRGDVMRAMTDPDFRFEIEGKLLSDKGDLLSLTAKESVATYGSPPERLLGEGIVETIEELLDSRFGKGGYRIEPWEVTWSEELAMTMQNVVPLLLGLGVLLLVIEFKTPGFGLFGGLGIALSGDCLFE
jgi:membrane-bound serine protease (ClpP class)